MADDYVFMGSGKRDKEGESNQWLSFPSGKQNSSTTDHDSLHRMPWRRKRGRGGRELAREELETSRESSSLCTCIHVVHVYYILY